MLFHILVFLKDIKLGFVFTKSQHYHSVSFLDHANQKQTKPSSNFEDSFLLIRKFNYSKFLNHSYRESSSFLLPNFASKADFTEFFLVKKLRLSLIIKSVGPMSFLVHYHNFMVCQNFLPELQNCFNLVEIFVCMQSWVEKRVGGGGSGGMVPPMYFPACLPRIINDSSH